METKPQIIDYPAISQLFSVLKEDGYKVIGPHLRDGAVVCEEIHSVSDLPAGWTDTHGQGKYTAQYNGGKALFGYTATAQSWKRYLHPAHHLIFQTHKSNGTLQVTRPAEVETKLAFLGVRACELAAIEIQDQVLLRGTFKDSVYEVHRNNAFLIAVNCTHAGANCFCASMKTGPRANGGFDLALTELTSPDHLFVVNAGTSRGNRLLHRLPHREATHEEVNRVNELVSAAEKQMGKELNTEGLQQALYGSYDHHRWDEVAARCLACANCTLVCPTCFCTTVDDVTDLSGQTAERWRRWDSCFNLDFSYIHGGTLRTSIKSRYRQWLTHKLATWVEQFGRSGCTGCGRCITWCPAGIDLTEEIRAIRSADRRAAASENEE